jgi:16S rRNA (guanine1207-N2)-methyltransferase
MDDYFKKEIIYPFEGQKFRFDVGETLFSTFDIDHGTDVLLRSISPKKIPLKILDLGCGYGPIGIVLGNKYPDAKVVLVDRDLLAVRYATYNIAKNNITNATALGSLGIEAVKDITFDLIVSNIPAKIGDEAISQEFILDPYTCLNPNGEYWIVVVSALNRLIPHVIEKYHMDMKYIRKRNGHTVYKIIKP